MKMSNRFLSPERGSPSIPAPGPAVGATYLDQRTLVAVFGSLASAEFADTEPTPCRPSRRRPGTALALKSGTGINDICAI